MWYLRGKLTGLGIVLFIVGASGNSVTLLGMGLGIVVLMFLWRAYEQRG